MGAGPRSDGGVLGRGNAFLTHEFLGFLFGDFSIACPRPCEYNVQGRETTPGVERLRPHENFLIHHGPSGCIL